MPQMTKFTELSDLQMEGIVGGNPVLVVGAMYGGVFVAGMAAGYLVNRR
ncbi:hypothetical protein [Leuconostoc rapi]|nr:hypothetical protein [Leuconostoc rapi]MBM7436403.1 hypothetical protein [Leuconostoc rapi]